MITLIFYIGKTLFKDDELLEGFPMPVIFILDGLLLFYLIGEILEKLI